VALGMQARRGAVRPPSHVHDTDVGSVEALREPVGRCQELGTGNDAMAGIIRTGGHALPPDPEKVRAIRVDLPATAAGIFMNAGTCGPIPVPAAQAMADAAERELTVGRAHRDAYDELLVRWTRRGPRWPPCSGRRWTASPSPAPLPRAWRLRSCRSTGGQATGSSPLRTSIRG